MDKIEEMSLWSKEFYPDNRSSRTHVGKIIKTNDSYEFKYITEQEALQYPGLRFEEKKHTWDFMHLFERRLPNKNRLDFKKFLGHWDLDESINNFDLLGITGGELRTDGFSFTKEYNLDDDIITFQSYVAGIGFDINNDNKDEIKAVLNNSEKYTIKLINEKNNKFDKNAIKIYLCYENKEPCPLGYLRRGYSSIVNTALERKDKKVSSSIKDYAINGIINYIRTEIKISTL